MSWIQADEQMLLDLHDAMFNATNCFKSKNTSRFNYYIDTINQLKA